MRHLTDAVGALNDKRQTGELGSPNSRIWCAGRANHVCSPRLLDSDQRSSAICGRINQSRPVVGWPPSRGTRSRGAGFIEPRPATECRRRDPVGGLFDPRHGESARAAGISLDRVESGGTVIPGLDVWPSCGGSRSWTSSIPRTSPEPTEMFNRALERGEAMGVVVRLSTASGEMRAIEVNVGARYGTNQKVSHLRCHLTDVTEKFQAEREQKLRTRELTRVNEQLRRINRELEELKERLASANDELSQKNRELDEFVYVVSHDLQEPLRTLIAFSDFLLKDYGDRLEPEGQEFVRYLVNASRRMRAMIHGMLNLSRAGKVIGDFEVVDLDDLVTVIRTDLGELLRSKSAQLHIALAIA